MNSPAFWLGGGGYLELLVWDSFCGTSTRSTHFTPENGPAIVLRVVFSHFGFGDPKHACLVPPCKVVSPRLEQVPVLRAQQQQQQQEGPWGRGSASEHRTSGTKPKRNQIQSKTTKRRCYEKYHMIWGPCRFGRVKVSFALNILVLVYLSGQSKRQTAVSDII